MIFKPLASSSSGNAYLVSDGKTDLLIECGIPWRKIREGCGFQTSKIAACLLSHSHLDHAKAAKDVARAGIDIYSSPEAIDALSEGGIPWHHLEPLYEGYIGRIGTFNVLGFKTRHDVSCVGFLLASGTHKLIFLTDTPYPSYRFKGLTHVAIECNYSQDILWNNVSSGRVHPDLAKSIVGNHMSLERCLRFLKSTDLSKVEAVWLLHLSDQNADEQMFLDVVRKATGKPVFVAGK